MTIRVAFWNLYRRDLTSAVVDLVRHERIDILILAESSLDGKAVPEMLTAATERTFRRVEIFSPRIKVFSSLSLRWFHVVDEPQHRRTCTFRLIGRESDILVTGVHLPSKTELADSDQTTFAARFARDIAVAERRLNIPRGLVCGDFNMNPFDDGMIGCDGFHAVLSKSIAERNGRIVLGEWRPFFYNPMWGMMGDGSPGPAGTFYYRSSNPHALFWHTFDQVLVRPAAMHLIGNVRIVDSIGELALTSRNGRPNRRELSDHLPVTFSISLTPCEE